MCLISLRRMTLYTHTFINMYIMHALELESIIPMFKAFEGNPSPTILDAKTVTIICEDLA